MVRWLDATPSDVGDPGRVHTEGRLARAVVEEAHEHVAALLGTRPRQVVFTGGGTEAVNTAIVAPRRRPPAPLSCSPPSSTPRPATPRRRPARRPRGGRPPRSGRTGRRRRHADALSFSTPRRPRPLPARQPRGRHGAAGRRGARLCRCRGVPVHVDACAAAGQLPLDLGALGAELVSVSAHKLGGPPGIGVLVVRRGTRLSCRCWSAASRSGPGGPGWRTSPASWASAACLLRRSPSRARWSSWRRRRGARPRRCWTRRSRVPGVVAYGDVEDRLPNLVCVGVSGVEAEGVVLGLDQGGHRRALRLGVLLGGVEPSPVLQAMGVDAERSLRLSVGWSTGAEDVEAFAGRFPVVVAQLRALRS